MSKKIMIASILIISVFIGYSIASLKYNEYKQHSQWLINEAEISFRYELFLMTSQLDQIYTLLMDPNSNEKCSYAAGRIDSFLSVDPFHEIQRILSPDNISEKISNGILDPALRAPIKDLIYNSRKHLGWIREAVLKPGDLEKLKASNTEFYELSNMIRELDFGNNNSLTDKTAVNEYIKKLEKINSLLSQSSLQ